MKKLIALSIFSLFLFILLGLLNSPYSVKAQNDDHVPGQILVKFKSNTPQNVVDAEVRRNSARVVDKISALDTLVLKVPVSQEDKVVTTLSRNPNVEYAELDYLATALMTPNDLYFPNQWGLLNTSTPNADIHATTAWDTTLGNGIRVAILDTGVSNNHSDLSSKVVGRANFSDAATDDDVYGHGTHVGGIVAALTNNSIGVAGGCPGCELLSVKVLNDSGSGAYSWIASGITWATQHEAKVINMSLGGSFKSSTLESAVNYAWTHGVVVVAAAGNSANASKIYPGAYNNVIAVASTNNLDQKSYFSSYGKWVDVAAPGENIYSTWNDNTSGSNPQPICLSAIECYKYASGTSMATPMTSAVAALIWSVPAYNTSAVSVRNRLESTADKIPGTGTYWSKGRVNAAKAVAP